MKKIIFVTVVLAALVQCGKKELQTQNSFSSSMFSGIIQGLDGTLVIENDLGEKATILQNGDFDFPSLWLPNADYSLKILDEPCAQRCTIDHPQGTVNSAGKVNVSIDCTSKTWSFPTSVSNHVSFSNTETIYVDLALNYRGDEALVWAQPDELGSIRLYKKEYRNRSWVSPFSLTDYFSMTGGDADKYGISMNKEGETVLAWAQNDGIYNQAYLSEYQDGRWVYPNSMYDRISVAGSNIISYNNNILVKSNDKGDAVVVWVQDNGPDQEIFQAVHLNGVWNFPETLLDNITPDGGGASVNHVDVAMNQKSDYVIVWEQSDGTHSQIYKAEYRNGNWIYPSGVSDHISVGGSDAHEPTVAIDDQGNTFIVWYQYDATGYNQIYDTQYRNGVWTYPATLSDNISDDGFHSHSPDIAMNNEGRAIVTWQEIDESGFYQIYKREYTHGILDDAARISPTGSDAVESRVGIDDHGNVLISWKQESLAGSNLFHVMKSEYRDGGWSHPSSKFDSFSPVSTNSREPEIIVNNCRMAMVWLQKNADGLYQSYAAEYR